MKTTSNIGGWAGWKQSCRRARAQTTVEFAFIVFLFLLLILATCDYAQIFFYQESLLNGVREAGRFATTGQILCQSQSNGVPTNPYGGTGGTNRLASIREIFRRTCVVGVATNNILIESWTGFGSTNVISNSAGNAGDYVHIKASYSLPLITPVISTYFSNGVYNTTAEMVFLNEPFNTNSWVYY